jgi:hypothetical protein
MTKLSDQGTKPTARSYPIAIEPVSLRQLFRWLAVEVESDMGTVSTDRSYDATRGAPDVVRQGR